MDSKDWEMAIAVCLIGWISICITFILFFYNRFLWVTIFLSVCGVISTGLLMAMFVAYRYTDRLLRTIDNIEIQVALGSGMNHYEAKEMIHSIRQELKSKLTKISYISLKRRLFGLFLLGMIFMMGTIIILLPVFS